jgi:hypothetical protein
MVKVAHVCADGGATVSIHIIVNLTQQYAQ